MNRKIKELTIPEQKAEDKAKIFLLLLVFIPLSLAAILFILLIFNKAFLFILLALIDGGLAI